MTLRLLGSAVLAGLVLGIGSAFFIIGRLATFGDSSYSGWRGNELEGQAGADIYTRAAIARTGLLALTREETLYFTRYVDADGVPLNERCTYLLEGADPPARWWSITLYAADNYLARNGDGAASMDQTRVVRREDGRFTIWVAAAADEGPNWISSRNAGDFSLTLRLYNPEADLLEDVGALRPPVIRTVSCAAGAA